MSGETKEILLTLLRDALETASADLERQKKRAEEVNWVAVKFQSDVDSLNSSIAEVEAL